MLDFSEPRILTRIGFLKIMLSIVCLYIGKNTNVSTLIFLKVDFFFLSFFFWKSVNFLPRGRVCFSFISFPNQGQIICLCGRWSQHVRNGKSAMKLDLQKIWTFLRLNKFKNVKSSLSAFWLHFDWVRMMKVLGRNCLTCKNMFWEYKFHIPISTTYTCRNNFCQKWIKC